MKILVTGATGYIGGRLIPLLLKADHEVRAMVRETARISDHAWSDQIEIAEGDVLEASSLDAALAGIEIAYYLIHSLAEGARFSEDDLKAAHNFGESAKRAGIRQIIYMGGLGANSDKQLSKHLVSRHKTGDALRESGVPITEFRAAVIVGSGGVSFEMVRYLVERLPIMVTPRWVYTRTQPIAIDDVLRYLLAAIDNAAAKDQIIEIGGSDILTYGDMMSVYAKYRGLHRPMIPVPVLSPQLSSYWVSLMTPVSIPVARALIEGLRNEVIVTDTSAERIFPTIQPVSYQAALQVALAHIQNDTVETSWTDALSSTETGKLEKFKADDKEGMLIARRQALINNDAATVFATVLRIGGKHGWYYGDFLWQIRGVMDRAIGGPGLRRSRRNPDRLRPGDVLDFWRVEALEQDKFVRLRAEMRLPGRAWLEFTLEPDSQKRTKLTQTAFFRSQGVLGWLYWYGINPIHQMVFSGMIVSIQKYAEAIGHDKVQVKGERSSQQAASDHPSL